MKVCFNKFTHTNNTTSNGSLTKYMHDQFMPRLQVICMLPLQMVCICQASKFVPTCILTACMEAKNHALSISDATFSQCFIIGCTIICLHFSMLKYVITLQPIACFLHSLHEWLAHFCRHLRQMLSPGGVDVQYQFCYLCLECTLQQNHQMTSCFALYCLPLMCTTELMA